MKTTFPPLPVPDEVFRTIIRMHEERHTYEQIGVVVGMSAQEVENLRWQHLDRWLHERATIGKAVRSDFIATIIAHLQLVMLTTENPKDLALLAKAMDSIAKHDPLRETRTPQPETPKPQQPAPTPLTNTTPAPPTPSEPLAPVDLTPSELAHLQALRDQCPTNTELLYKMQQTPTLYEKCLQLGRLPQIEKPESPTPPTPTPPVQRSWANKLFTGFVYALLATTAFLGSYRLRTYLDEPTPTTGVRTQAHPPNH